MQKLFFIVLLLVNKAYAQANTATLNLQVCFPQGDYKKTYPVTSSGLIFGIAHTLKDQPAFSIAGEVGILQVSGANKYYTGFYNNEYNTFVVASWNHILTFAATLKVNLLSEDESWKLYIDCSFGSNAFVTFSSISRDLYRDPITNTDVTKFYYSDLHTAWTLRAGGGMEVEIPLGLQKKIALVFKGSYLYGSNASYYARPAIHNTHINLAPRSSNTSMLLAETGIRFGIFNKQKE